MSALVLLLAASGCVPVLETPRDTSATPWTWEAPENRWPSGAPPEGLEGQGFGAGQVLEDFRLRDQHGDEVALWQFYGRVLVVDVSTLWCAPCQELARGTEETAEAFADRGLVYVTVLAEDLEGDPPERDDLELWAQSFAITAPIVGDVVPAWSAPAVPDDAYPGLFVVDTRMRVHRRVTPATDENLRAAIEDALD